MPRILATLMFLLLAGAANAQVGSSTPSTFLPALLGTPTPDVSQQPAPTTQLPAQMPPQVTPQLNAPIFPAPAGQTQAPSATPPAPTSNPPAAAAPAPVVAPAPGAQPFNYGVNINSSVFGAKMFTGNFLQSTSSLFNPEHVISIGDQLQVRLWGAYQLDMLVMVDAQGNVFLPQVGPVRAAGVANRDLQKVLDEAIRRTFRANVFSYISLAAAQPVRVFVTGFVNRPGMYQGTSTDSVLRYLDQAGGIDPDRGSFLDVKVLRGSLVRGTFNLYDFLLKGTLPAVQLGDGDVVVVAPRKPTFIVIGLAENTYRFEFADSNIAMSRLIELGRPFPSATHMRVTRNTGVIQNTEYYPISDNAKVQLVNGDQVEFTADKRPGTISVRVQGEHLTPQEYVVPYGSRLGEVMKQIKFSDRSDVENIQLFRQSVQTREAALLQNALNGLEKSVLTARSGTQEEAQLRTSEANLVLNWTARARNIQPLGQVVIAQSAQRDDLLLENSDVINIPVKDGLVLTHGELLFPNAIAYDPRYVVDDYIKRSGGYTQTADSSRIVIAHRDGSYSGSADNEKIRPGDNILVLQKVETKTRQFWKDVTQIMFQIAVSAGIVFGL